MKAKLSLLAGAAIGYVLGAKAGRQSYEQIKGRASKAWSSDPVQLKLETAKEAVKTKAPVIAEKVGEAAKLTSSKLKDKVTGEELPESVDHVSEAKLHAEVNGFGPGPGELA